MEQAQLQKTIVLLVLLLSLSSGTGAQRVTTLQSLTQLSSEDLSTAIVRIDYHGASEKSPAIVSAMKGTQIDWKRLRAVPGLEVGPPADRYRRRSSTVTAQD